MQLCKISYLLLCLTVVIRLFALTTHGKPAQDSYWNSGHNGGN
jgi:hypothetical protein